MTKTTSDAIDAYIKARKAYFDLQDRITRLLNQDKSSVILAKHDVLEVLKKSIDDYDKEINS